MPLDEPEMLSQTGARSEHDDTVHNDDDDDDDVDTEDEHFDAEDKQHIDDSDDYNDRDDGAASSSNTIAATDSNGKPTNAAASPANTKHTVPPLAIQPAAAGAAATASKNASSATEMPPGLPEFVRFNSFNKLHAKPSGNSVTIKCPARGNPPPTITWSKNGVQPIVREIETAIRYRKFAIVMEDLIPSDSGDYTCNVCNEYGCISWLTKLFVNRKYLKSRWRRG